MKSSVYISAEQIQVIGYTGNTVKRFVACPLPEGTVYNGTITDDAVLAERLASVRKGNPELFRRGVTLIVDGSSILSRRLAAPKLNKTRYMQLIRDDFADSADSPHDLVCGYRVLDAAENAILACAVNKALIDRYCSAFQEAGVRVGAIHIGIEAIHGFVRSRQEFRNTTAVLNVVDGLTMLSILLENKNNVFMSRTRLYGDSREQVFQNILENLNGLIQFTRSQKFGEITDSYYLGLNDTDSKLLEAYNPYAGIRLATLAMDESRGAVPADAHFAYLNMLFGGGGIDLIRARKDLDKYIRKKNPKRLWIPFLALAVMAIAAVAADLRVKINETEKKAGEIKRYIQSPAVEQKQDELDLLLQETSFYAAVAQQADEKAAWENTMPEASGDILDQIVFPQGIDLTVTSFEFDENTGVVRLKADCAGAHVSADYVDALYRSGVARSVNYQGYGSNADGVFTFAVDIYLVTVQP